MGIVGIWKLGQRAPGRPGISGVKDQYSVAAPPRRDRLRLRPTPAGADIGTLSKRALVIAFVALFVASATLTCNQVVTPPAEHAQAPARPPTDPLSMPTNPYPERPAFQEPACDLAFRCCQAFVAAMDGAVVERSACASVPEADRLTEASGRCRLLTDGWRQVVQELTPDQADRCGAATSD